MSSIYVCMLHVKSLQSCSTLCDPVDCSPWGSSVNGESPEYWSGLPCPSPGTLPDPGIESVSLTSPVLASGFFTTSATRMQSQFHGRKYGPKFLGNCKKLYRLHILVNCKGLCILPCKLKNRKRRSKCSMDVRYIQLIWTKVFGFKSYAEQGYYRCNSESTMNPSWVYCQEFAEQILNRKTKGRI